MLGSSRDQLAKLLSKYSTKPGPVSVPLERTAAGPTAKAANGSRHLLAPSLTRTQSECQFKTLTSSTSSSIKLK